MARESFVEAFGLAGMLGADSTVGGYYLTYAVWHRVRPWQRRGTLP